MFIVLCCKYVFFNCTKFKRITAFQLHDFESTWKWNILKCNKAVIRCQKKEEIYLARIYLLFIAISFVDLCDGKNLNLKATVNANISINSLPAYVSHVFLWIFMWSEFLFTLIRRRKMLGSNKSYFLGSFEANKKLKPRQYRESKKAKHKNELNKCNEMLSLHNKSSFIILTNDNESAEKSTTLIFLSSHSFLFPKQRVVYIFEMFFKRERESEWKNGNLGWYSNLRPLKYINARNLRRKPFTVALKQFFIVEVLEKKLHRKENFPIRVEKLKKKWNFKVTSMSPRPSLFGPFIPKLAFYRSSVEETS